MLVKISIKLVIVTFLLCHAMDVNSQVMVKSPKANPVPVKNFKHSDIGSPSIAGSVKISSNGFDITAAGTDIWGVKDEFHFVYIERTGDFDFAARIESLVAGDLYTKAGIMAREDLTASCRHIYFQVFSDNNPRNKNNGGYEFQYRSAKAGEMKAIYPKSAEGTPEFPVKYPNTWVRLQRVKNEFTGYYSTDGQNWKVYTKFSLELPETLYLGLAVTSHNPYHAILAKFRNIAEFKH
jgi:regulation of enolase protein 1 (concanavalin A-like superfamily)